MTQDPLTCFKTDGIRGRMHQELTLELVRKIGLAFAAEVRSGWSSPFPADLPTVCVGRDTHHTSKDIVLVLINGLEDGGVNVADIGQCGMGEVCHAIFSQGFDGGIMISAHHSQANQSSITIMGKNAVPLDSGNGLTTIRERILTGNTPIAVKPGICRQHDSREAYVRFLLSFNGEQRSQTI